MGTLSLEEKSHEGVCVQRLQGCECVSGALGDLRLSFLGATLLPPFPGELTVRVTHHPICSLQERKRKLPQAGVGCVPRLSS